MVIYRKSLYKKMWNLSYPLMLANLSVVLLNFIDIKMVGVLGKDAVAAVGISLSLIWLLQVPILESFMDNAVIIFTRYSTMNSWNKLAQVFFQECKIAFLLGIATWLFLIPFYYICDIMAENATIASMAFSYCLIIILGFPICAIGAIGMRLLLALNMNKVMSAFSICSVVVNILLDYLLIFGECGFPKMGVSGAALGTMIAKMFENLGFFFVALRFILANRTVKKRAEKRIYKEILHSGTTLFTASLVESLAWSCFTFNISKLGTIALAAQETVMRLKDISYVPSTAICNVAASVVGQERGKNNVESARCSGISCMHLSIMITSIFSTTFLIFADQLVGFLISDIEVIKAGANLLRFIALYQLIDVVYTIFKGCLRGVGDLEFIKKNTVFFSWVIWIPLSLIFIYICGFGLIGAWVSLGIFSLSLAIRYSHRFMNI